MYFNHITFWDPGDTPDYTSVYWEALHSQMVGVSNGLFLYFGGRWTMSLFTLIACVMVNTYLTN